jgi:hypothetical protein
MRKSFAPLDDVLIERLFQPASDFVSNRLGFSRATAACFCIDFASLAWIASRVRGLSDAVTARDASTAFLDLSFLLLGLVAMIALRTVLRKAEGKQGNPLRPAMQPHRAIVLLLLLADVVQLQAPSLANTADLVMLAFAASAMYLGACAERPPVRHGWPALVPTA